MIHRYTMGEIKNKGFETINKNGKLQAKKWGLKQAPKHHLLTNVSSQRKGLIIKQAASTLLCAAHQNTLRTK
jgi:hypothetical protein